MVLHRPVETAGILSKFELPRMPSAWTRLWTAQAFDQISGGITRTQWPYSVALSDGIMLYGVAEFITFSSGKPRISLGRLAKREEVWAKMRELKVAGRMFRAFTAMESYEHELRQRLNAINPPALIN